MPDLRNDVAEDISPRQVEWNEHEPPSETVVLRLVLVAVYTTGRGANHEERAIWQDSLTKQLWRRFQMVREYCVSLTYWEVAK